MLVAYTRGDWVAGSSPFNVINFFVTEFAEFNETHLEKTPLLREISYEIKATEK